MPEPNGKKLEIGHFTDGTLRIKKSADSVAPPVTVWPEEGTFCGHFVGLPCKEGKAV